MSKYKIDTIITFYASLGYVKANKEEKFTLEELGFTESELNDMTDDQIEHDIQIQFEEWLYNHDVGWFVE